jgi:choline kinase/phosphoglycolate phosphatase-like HAD superfamily hydrolase/phosphatidylglycerophosphate synthase
MTDVEEDLLQALVLAGGMGSRLGRPRGRVKPLVPVAGVALLERSVRTLTLLGVQAIVVVTGYRGEEVAAFSADLSSLLQVPIKCVHNYKHEAGNGLSVLAAEDVITQHGTENFLLVMADHVMSEHLLRRLVASVPPDGGAVVAVDFDIRPRPEVDPHDVTRVLVQDGLVQKIGKGITPFNGYDTGAFVCTPGVFSAIRAAISDGDTTLTAGLRRLAMLGRLSACEVTDCKWFDVDTGRDRRCATRALLRDTGKSRDGAVAARMNRILSRRVFTPALLWAAPHITPNQVTLLAAGIGFAAVAAVLAGSAVLGAMLVQIASVLDGSDGEIARVTGRGSRYGAFLDSTLDRVVDGFLLGAIGIYLTRLLGPSVILQVLCVFAVVGHLLVSYTSARAEVDLGHRYGGALFASGRGRDLRLFIVTVTLAGSPIVPVAPAFGLAFVAALSWLIVMVRLVWSWQVAMYEWADVDLVLVDFDGTVADSMPALTRLAVEAITAELPFDAASARDRYLETTGTDFASQLSEFAPEYPEQRRRAVERFEASKEAALAKVNPFPEVRSFLDALAEVGVPVSLCTSTRIDLIRVWLDEHHLTEYFARIDGWQPGYPKAEQIGAALAELGVSAQRCLFVGDSRRDAELARAAGVRFCGVLRPMTNLVGAGVPYKTDLAKIARVVARRRAVAVEVQQAPVGPKAASPDGRASRPRQLSVSEAAATRVR